MKNKYLQDLNNLIAPKGTDVEISGNIPVRVIHADSQQCTFHLYLISNEEDIVDLLAYSCSIW